MSTDFQKRNGNIYDIYHLSHFFATYFVAHRHHVPIRTILRIGAKKG